MIAYIREYIKEFIDEKVSEKTRILYSGSVNEINSKELIKLKDIDGFLVIINNKYDKLYRLEL